LHFEVNHAGDLLGRWEWIRDSSFCSNFADGGGCGQIGFRERFGRSCFLHNGRVARKDFLLRFEKSANEAGIFRGNNFRAATLLLLCALDLAQIRKLRSDYFA